jgi:hypothetical protein
MQLLEINFQYVEVVVMVVYFALLGMLLFEFRAMKEKITERMDLNNEGLKLKLHALERLTLFTERSGLQNLVGRIENLQTTASALHHSLVETIRSEYEHNITQQIYVNPEVWNAVTRLKDQNIYIINQLALHLPPQATAVDLSKRILEYSMNHNAELNVVVLDALQYEAKKIID